MTCTECTSELILDDEVEEGEIISCDECGADYEVMQTSPLRLRSFDDSDEDEDFDDVEEEEYL